MGINITKRTQVEVSAFEESVGKISIKEIESSMEAIDVNKPETVAKAVKRCNDRCKDNEVDLELEVLRPVQGSGPDKTEKISLAFHLC